MSSSREMDQSLALSKSSSEEEADECCWMNPEEGVGEFDDQGNYIVRSPASPERPRPPSPIYYDRIDTSQIDLNELSVRSISARFVLLTDTEIDQSRLNLAQIDPFSQVAVIQLPNANIRSMMWFVLTTLFDQNLCEHVLIHLGNRDFNQNLMPVPEFVNKVEQLIHITRQKVRRARIYFSGPMLDPELVELSLRRIKLLQSALYRLAKRLGPLFFSLVRFVDWKLISFDTNQLLLLKPNDPPKKLGLNELRSELFKTLATLIKGSLLGNNDQQSSSNNKMIMRPLPICPKIHCQVYEPSDDDDDEDDEDDDQSDD